METSALSPSSASGQGIGVAVTVPSRSQGNHCVAASNDEVLKIQGPISVNPADTHQRRIIMSNEAAALIVIAVLAALTVVTVLIIRRRSHRRSAADRIGLPPLGSLTGRPGTDETKLSSSASAPQRSERL